MKERLPLLSNSNDAGYLPLQEPTDSDCRALFLLAARPVPRHLQVQEHPMAPPASRNLPQDFYRRF